MCKNAKYITNKYKQLKVCPKYKSILKQRRPSFSCAQLLKIMEVWKSFRWSKLRENWPPQFALFSASVVSPSVQVSNCPISNVQVERMDHHRVLLGSSKNHFVTFIRARWNVQCHYFYSGRVDSYVKLNFKASLFSCIFWFEDSLLCKIALLVFGLFTL